MRPLDRKKFFIILVPTIIAFVLVVFYIPWITQHLFIRALIGGAFFAFVCWLRIFCQKK
ncbi:MAG: hypothetical protein VB031_00465 [Eubacteriaceae bacterium]|nr:hypothetical protein [Eubacteriaceae bacterium]